MAKQTGLSRREFIQSMGAAALYLPVLPSLFPLSSHAQAAGAPLRVIFIMNRNGQTGSLFYPAMAGTQVQPNIYQGSLASITGSISPIFGQSYNALKSKVSILRGLDIIGYNDHCRTSFLCGVTQGGAGNSEDSPPPFGASADWIIERSTAFYPTLPLRRALRFSNGGGRGFSFENVGGVIRSLPFAGSDSSFFNTAFGNVVINPATPVAPAARKSFLLDRAIERLNGLAANRRLSSLDSKRVAEHASNLNDIKKGLTVTVPTSCAIPRQTYFNESADMIRKKYQNVFDTIVAAFTCDVSRIASVYIEDYNDSQTDYSAFHNVSHEEPTDPGHISASTANNSWIADRVAYLISKLDSTMDINGRPMLENTLVFWGSEIACKDGAESHRGESMPVLIAGWPSLFRMGSYIDFRTRPFQHVANRGDFPAIGRPYTQLLCSIMLAAGVQKSEFTAFGKNGYFGEFVRTEYNPTFYDGYATVRNDPLPYFRL